MNFFQVKNTCERNHRNSSWKWEKCLLLTSLKFKSMRIRFSLSLFFLYLMEFFNRNVIPLNFMLLRRKNEETRVSLYVLKNDEKWNFIYSHSVSKYSPFENCFIKSRSRFSKWELKKVAIESEEAISWEIIKSSIENDHHHSFSFLDSLSIISLLTYKTNLYRLELLHHHILWSYLHKI